MNCELLGLSIDSIFSHPGLDPANLITRAGADRVLTMDLHAGQIQGFFDIPTDNLAATPVLAQDIKENYARGGRPTSSSLSDVGGVVRARSLASRLDADLAIVDKRRPKAARARSRTSSATCRAAAASCSTTSSIRAAPWSTPPRPDRPRCDRGFAYISYGVPSGPAVQRITDGPLKELVITNSIEQPHEVLNCPKIRAVSVAPLVGEAIRRIANEESVSKLFD